MNRWLLALIAILASGSALADENPSETVLRSKIAACDAGIGPCVVDLDADTTLSKTLRLCPGIKLRGAGSGRTFLRAATSTSAIEVLAYTRCKAEGRPASGVVEIEGVKIIGTLPGSVSTRGIRAEHTIVLRDVAVDRFTVGIEITASALRKPFAALADSWLFDRVFVQRAEHAGVWIHDADSNVGTWIGGSASSNCQRASKWNDVLASSPLPCAGVVERSFLGNTLIGVHTASNVELRDGCNSIVPSCIVAKYPGFDFDGASQHSVCVGCYSENDQAPSELSAYDAAIGGLASWVGSGLRADGKRIKSLEIINDLDPNNVTTIKMGAATNYGGAFLDFTSTGIGVSSLRLISDGLNREWRFNVSNIPYPIRITGANKYGADGSISMPLGTLRLHYDLLKIEGTPP